MAGAKPAMSLETQYELNSELSQQLGLFDPRTFPKLEDIAPSAELVMQDESLLVISPSVATIPFRSCVRGDKSLVSAFSGIGTIVINGSAVRFGAEIRSGSHFAKTKVKDPVHDRGITSPYHVAILPEGFSEDGSKGLEYTASTTEEQLEKVAERSTTTKNETVIPDQFITAGLYLVANALRRVSGKEYLQGHTRCPFYGLTGKGRATRYIPTLSSRDSRGVVIQEFTADNRSPIAGIRLVHDIVVA